MRGLRRIIKRTFHSRVSSFRRKHAWREATVFKRLSLPTALLLLVLFAAACSDTPNLNTGESAPTTATGPVTLDDQFAEVAQKAPGFGGMFYDDDGVLSAYMVQPTGELSAQAARAQQTAVKGAITAVFGRDVLRSQAVVDEATDKELKPQSRTTELNLLPAKYSFLQLREWYRPLSSLLSVPGVLSTDIDEAKNRLVIGVDEGNSEVRAQVEQELATLNIPREAVVIEASEPIVLAHHSASHSLRHYGRPLTGGLQIDYNNSWCTLGFNTYSYYYGAWGFITNSHCTRIQGGTEGTRYAQGGYWVGTETADPTYALGPITYANGMRCPSGRYCRWSDSAFVRYDANVSFALGKVARTTYPGQAQGSLYIDRTYPTFNVASEMKQAPLVGLRLAKMGRTTGWTSGAITNSCRDHNVYVRANGVSYDTGKTQLCQVWVNNGLGGGDSGSPVFAGNANALKLYGIAWAGNSSSMIYSPISFVEFELGSLYTFNGDSR